MREEKENNVAKSLQWLSNMFPYVEHPENEVDRMSNAIHIYSKAGAEKIQELEQKLERQWTDQEDGITVCCGYDMGTEQVHFCPMCGKKIRY